MQLIPSEGSGRYSPGPGMVELLEERSYQEIRLPVAICSQTPPGILAIDSDFPSRSAQRLRTFWLRASYRNSYEPPHTTSRRCSGADHGLAFAAAPRPERSSAAAPPRSSTVDRTPLLGRFGPAGPPGAGPLGPGPTLGLDPLPPSDPRPRRAARTLRHRSPIADRLVALRDDRGHRPRPRVGPALHRERPLQVASRWGLAQLSHPQRFPGRPRGGPRQPLDPDDRRLDPGPNR